MNKPKTMKTIKEAYGIKLRIVENKVLPPKGFVAINLGWIFTRDAQKLTESVLRHEAIHTVQAREMLFVPYYLLYLLEYLVKLFICGNADKAYKSISFEQEAYLNSKNPNYLQERKNFAWAKYIFKMYNNS